MQTPSRKMRLTPELVDRCHRDVPDPGQAVDKYDYFTEEDYTAAVQKLLAGRPAGPLWIFAYGSLMWRPEFNAVESRRAVAEGWKRGFSLEVTRFRGSTEQPGYMMCLDSGGCCEGLALRLSDKQAEDQLRQLLLREVGGYEALEAVRWIEVESIGSPLRALTFYAAPALLDFYKPNRPLKRIAAALARACGHWGSGAEYLRNTVCHLEEMGIHDHQLWILQEMVAEEILALPSA